MRGKKVCPLIILGKVSGGWGYNTDDNNVKCLKEECAWYNILEKECVILKNNK